MTRYRRRKLIRAWVLRCVYCGEETKGKLTCAACSDLPALDPLMRERLAR